MSLYFVSIVIFFAFVLLKILIQPENILLSSLFVGIILLYVAIVVNLSERMK